MINFTLKAKYSKDGWIFELIPKSTGKMDIALSEEVKYELLKVFQHLILHKTVQERHKHLFVVLTNPEAPIHIDELLTIKNLN